MPACEQLAQFYHSGLSQVTISTGVEGSSSLKFEIDFSEEEEQVVKNLGAVQSSDFQFEEQLISEEELLQSIRKTFINETVPSFDPLVVTPVDSERI